MNGKQNAMEEEMNALYINIATMPIDKKAVGVDGYMPSKHDSK